MTSYSSDVTDTPVDRNLLQLWCQGEVISTITSYSSDVNDTHVNSSHLQQWCQWGSTTLNSQQQSLTAVVSMGVYHPPQSTAITYSSGVNGGLPPSTVNSNHSSGVNGGLPPSTVNSNHSSGVNGGLPPSTVNSNHLQQWCQWGVYHSPQSTAITYSSGVNGGSITLHSQQQSLTAVVSIGGLSLSTGSL